ncbi:putative Ras-specific guanine nucleotide-releasing factor 2 [Blattamonas nauphoetae]|uniref:Ras-specific guanine nucleotide-releasing factor 2 n=1 Tax=Blattamonas nauphoetae TaxID=2049346 RepID=A0ABQ9XPD3_9EUKA|nr:putative Ras-specific guanine nucleotide-releasing factor 2 [Blattamonas nauphoetae]
MTSIPPPDIQSVHGTESDVTQSSTNLVLSKTHQSGKFSPMNIPSSEQSHSSTAANKEQELVFSDSESSNSEQAELLDTDHYNPDVSDEDLSDNDLIRSKTSPTEQESREIEKMQKIFTTHLSGVFPTTILTQTRLSVHRLSFTESPLPYSDNSLLTFLIDFVDPDVRYSFDEFCSVYNKAHGPSTGSALLAKPLPPQPSISHLSYQDRILDLFELIQRNEHIRRICPPYPPLTSAKHPHFLSLQESIRNAQTMTEQLANESQTITSLYNRKKTGEPIPESSFQLNRSFSPPFCYPREYLLDEHGNKAHFDEEEENFEEMIWLSDFVELATSPHSSSHQYLRILFMCYREVTTRDILLRLLLERYIWAEVSSWQDIERTNSQPKEDDPSIISDWILLDVEDMESSNDYSPSTSSSHSSTPFQSSDHISHRKFHMPSTKTLSEMFLNRFRQKSATPPPSPPQMSISSNYKNDLRRKLAPLSLSTSQKDLRKIGANAFYTNASASLSSIDISLATSTESPPQNTSSFIPTTPKGDTSGNALRRRRTAVLSLHESDDESLMYFPIQETDNHEEVRKQNEGKPDETTKDDLDKETKEVQSEESLKESDEQNSSNSDTVNKETGDEKAIKDKEKKTENEEETRIEEEKEQKKEEDDVIIGEKDEEEQKRKDDEEKKLKEETERRQKEEEERLHKEEEERKRQEEEERIAREKAEEEERLRKEEEERKRQEEEERVRKEAEEERLRKEEEEQRRVDAAIDAFHTNYVSQLQRCQQSSLVIRHNVCSCLQLWVKTYPSDFLLEEGEMRRLEEMRVNGVNGESGKDVDTEVKSSDGTTSTTRLTSVSPFFSLLNTFLHLIDSEHHLSSLLNTLTTVSSRKGYSWFNVHNAPPPNIPKTWPTSIFIRSLEAKEGSEEKKRCDQQLKDALNSTWQVELIEIDPKELARQITLIESNLFVKIESVEFVELGWMKTKSKSDRSTTLEPSPLCTSSTTPTDSQHSPSPSPFAHHDQKGPRSSFAPPNPSHTPFLNPTPSSNLRSLILHFNRMSLWISTCVLSPTLPYLRAKVVEYFISLSTHFLKLNNFVGIMEVVTGLQRKSIRRLTSTWALVSRSRREEWERIVLLTELRGRFRNLRQRMQQSQPPLVPYFGLYLTDLVYINESQNVGPSGRVHLKKLSVEWKVIADIKKTALQPYALNVVSELWGYLLNVAGMGEEELMAHSLVIEPKVET